MPEIEFVPLNSPAALAEMQELQRDLMRSLEKALCISAGVMPETIIAANAAPVMAEYRDRLKAWEAKHG